MKKLTKRSKIELFTPILIKWKDPCAYSGWKNYDNWIIMTTENKAHIVGMECVSCGFFACKNEDGIVLCMNFTEKESNDIGMIFEIPWGVVTEIWKLE